MTKTNTRLQYLNTRTQILFKTTVKYHVLNKLNKPDILFTLFLDCFNG